MGIIIISFDIIRFISIGYNWQTKQDRDFATLSRTYYNESPIWVESNQFSGRTMHTAYLTLFGGLNVSYYMMAELNWFQ
jgi:hypothetical protein